MSKTVLITGSSSGIGKATAILFAEQGWNVIATMRTPEKETELSQKANIFFSKSRMISIYFLYTHNIYF